MVNPGVSNRTFGFRTKSNEIERLNSMLFGRRTKSNSQKINANRTKSNVGLRSMRFDLVLSLNDT